MNLKHILLGVVFVFVAFKVYQRVKHPWKRTPSQCKQNQDDFDDVYSL